MHFPTELTENSLSSAIHTILLKAAARGTTMDFAGY